MAESSPTPKAAETETKLSTSVPTKPLNCFSGAFVSGSLALLLYRLAHSIAITFAHKPVTSDNITVLKISVAVRTLVVGMVALGAGVFGLAAVGLAALGVQILIQRLLGKRSPADE